MGCGFSKSEGLPVVEQSTTGSTLVPAVTGQHLTKPHTDTGKNELLPLYNAVPPGTTKEKARNVYDGDTLTLLDGRRVRLLGIDTPELKEKQPYSEEAKNHTKHLCENKEIWIRTDPEHETDHYGRLLAWVWVRTGTGVYLCVNESIVAAGLASVYVPNTGSKIDNLDKLISQQKRARQDRLGLWKTFNDCTVYKTKNGTAYHIQSCKHLTNSKHLITTKSSAALDEGLHPCRTCMG